MYTQIKCLPLGRTVPHCGLQNFNLKNDLLCFEVKPGKILVKPVSLRILLKMLNLFVCLPETGKKVDQNYQLSMNSAPTPLGPASCFSAVRLILSERSLSKLASNSLISSARFPPWSEDDMNNHTHLLLQKQLLHKFLHDYWDDLNQSSLWKFLQNIAELS